MENRMETIERNHTSMKGIATTMAAIQASIANLENKIRSSSRSRPHASYASYRKSLTSSQKEWRTVSSGSQSRKASLSSQGSSLSAKVSSHASQQQHRTINHSPMISRGNSGRSLSDFDHRYHTEDRTPAQAGRKVDLPWFNGDEVYGWIVRMEHYFSLKATAEKDKVEVTAGAMEE
ncbi:unnamed protein product [Cuscuta epithymum]|uniref:Uncharacterized protein n=1 Tax=Cuscuta epithymum TaxID=186058 RepID=A0AAV0GDQ2_9ASTE|nr:unnamed protein product [Cuscuta epithymum]